MAKTATTKETSKGMCNFCEAEFEKGKMTQHLKYCKQRKASIESANTQDAEHTRLLHLVVEGYRLPAYWMHLEMPVDATLVDLDDFLRATWLECCGHLSAFRIGKASYSSQTEDMYWGFADPQGTSEEETNEDETDEDELEESELSPIEVVEQLLETLSAEFQSNLVDVPLPELEAKLSEILTTRLGVSLSPEMQSQIGNLAHYLQLSSSLLQDSYREHDMDIELKDVLKVGQKFSHEYDFGSTTELALRVVTERDGVLMKDEDGDPVAVQVLARNEAPIISCRVCGKPATKVAAGYFYVEGGALCDTCARTSSKEYEDSFLPIVNSPRVGVCGYTGPDDGYTWDEWDEDEEDEEVSGEAE